MSLNALIIGTTGLVGHELFQQLLGSDYYKGIVSISRKPLGISEPGVKQYQVDFNDLKSLKLDQNVDDVFCCLGTTIKKAGSREAFYKVDYQYVLDAARMALDHGASHFYLVSSMGASPSSRLFYLRVKGEVEKSISALPFKGVHIFRPALLLGPRKEKRIGEEIAKNLMSLVGPILPGNNKAIHARDVAKAMFIVAKERVEQNKIYLSGEIRMIAGKQSSQS